jgi:hypothetical protein
MSGLLDPVQLAMGRSMLAANLHSTCTIYAVAEVDGGHDWPGPGVTVRCMKGNPSRGGSESMSYEGTAPYSRFWVSMGTVLHTGDKVVYNGTSYFIDQLPSIHASELLQPIDCLEVRSPGDAVDG